MANIPNVNLFNDEKRFKNYLLKSKDEAILLSHQELVKIVIEILKNEISISDVIGGILKENNTIILDKIDEDNAWLNKVVLEKLMWKDQDTFTKLINYKNKKNGDREI
jgi:hypothetical protein